MPPDSSRSPQNDSWPLAGHGSLVRANALSSAETSWTALRGAQGSHPSWAHLGLERPSTPQRAGFARTSIDMTTGPASRHAGRRWPNETPDATGVEVRADTWIRILQPGGEGQRALNPRRGQPWSGRGSDRALEWQEGEDRIVSRYQDLTVSGPFMAIPNTRVSRATWYSRRLHSRRSPTSNHSHKPLRPSFIPPAHRHTTGHSCNAIFYHNSLYAKRLHTLSHLPPCTSTETTTPTPPTLPIFPIPKYVRHPAHPGRQIRLNRTTVLGRFPYGRSSGR